MTWKPDIMIYHANCADGFGAAWAAWMKWGDAVEYVDCSYGDQPPEVLGKHVLIGDFSFKREAMERIAPGAASIVVLDHHKTAKQELAPWCYSGSAYIEFNVDTIARWQELSQSCVTAVFDKNRSGAVMTWQFCHPGVEVPRLLELIEDRDLWRFIWPDTKPFGLWLRSEPFDFVRWSGIERELTSPRYSEIIGAEAKAMMRFHDQKVAEIGRTARVSDIAGHRVWICNCPYAFASEVGHWLLDQYPFTPFVACYADNEKGRSWSLRSEDHRIDVSEVAKRFGGGGHRNAAGFTVPLP